LEYEILQAIAFNNVVLADCITGFHLDRQFFQSMDPFYDTAVHPYSPRDGFRDESVVGLACKAGGRQILAYAFTNLSSLFAFVQ
jgi:hypothetical protein